MLKLLQFNACSTLASRYDKQVKNLTIVGERNLSPMKLLEFGRTKRA